MSGPVNSPISDSTPYSPPTNTETAKKVPQSEWDKLGKTRQYKDVDAYLEARKEFHRHFLPGGTPITDLTSNEELAMHYKLASMMIDEIENIQLKVQTFKRKR